MSLLENDVPPDARILWIPLVISYNEAPKQHQTCSAEIHQQQRHQTPPSRIIFGKHTLLNTIHKGGPSSQPILPSNLPRLELPSTKEYPNNASPVKTQLPILESPSCSMRRGKGCSQECCLCSKNPNFGNRESTKYPNLERRE